MVYAASAQLSSKYFRNQHQSVLNSVELSRHQESLLRSKVTLAQFSSAEFLLTYPCCCTLCRLMHLLLTETSLCLIFLNNFNLRTNNSLKISVKSLYISPTCNFEFLEINYRSTFQHPIESYNSLGWKGAPNVI